MHTTASCRARPVKKEIHSLLASRSLLDYLRQTAETRRANCIGGGQGNYACENLLQHRQPPPLSAVDSAKHRLCMGLPPQKSDRRHTALCDWSAQEDCPPRRRWVQSPRRVGQSVGSLHFVSAESTCRPRARSLGGSSPLIVCNGASRAAGTLSSADRSSPTITTPPLTRTGRSSLHSTYVSCL